MARTITLAKSLPGYPPEQRARSRGDTCEFVRDQTETTGRHITFVKFPDGERRLLLDADIEPDEDYKGDKLTINPKHTDVIATWYDEGGEGGWG